MDLGLPKVTKMDTDANTSDDDSSKEIIFPCKQCQEEFTSKTKRKRHVRESHQKEVCIHLRDHSSLRISKDPDSEHWQCVTLCSKRFKTADGLQRHAKACDHIQTSVCNDKNDDFEAIKESDLDITAASRQIIEFVYRKDLNSSLENDKVLLNVGLIVNTGFKEVICKHCQFWFEVSVIIKHLERKHGVS